MAATLIMLIAGAASLLGAGMVFQWARAQDELAALWGIFVIALVAIPLALAGLLLLGAGLRGAGALRAKSGNASATNRRRFDPLASLGSVLILFAIIGITTWAVIADRLAMGALVIGVTLALLFGVEALRDRTQRRQA